jgi:hypothetical protein
MPFVAVRTAKRMTGEGVVRHAQGCRAAAPVDDGRHPAEKRATVTSMTEKPWHVVDPERMLREVQAHHPFELGTVLIAALDLGDQHVTGVRALGPDALDGVSADVMSSMGSEIVRKVAEELVPERWANGSEGNGITHLLVTVVCREGRVVPSRRENDWAVAWRYANHFRAAFDGDIYVVTPHGWTGCMDHRAGYEPHAIDPAA